jgi:hypothetical protein
LAVSQVEGDPKATTDPIGLPNLPVGTNNMPFPIDGPPIPISDPTLNVHNILPVSLSSAIIIPVDASRLLVAPPNVDAVYGFPTEVLS